MPTRSLKLRLCRLKDFVVHRVLHVDDSPHRLALGAAIGMFVTFLPIIGFQTILVVVLATLLRGNKAMGLPIVWITNPVTIVPIFYACYVVGLLLLGQEGIRWQWWADLRSPPPGWWASTYFFYTKLLQVAWPLWAGCLVVGAASGTLVYGLTYGAVSYYRARLPGRVPRSDEASV